MQEKHVRYLYSCSEFLANRCVKLADQRGVAVTKRVCGGGVEVSSKLAPSLWYALTRLWLKHAIVLSRVIRRVHVWCSGRVSGITIHLVKQVVRDTVTYRRRKGARSKVYYDCRRQVCRALSGSVSIKRADERVLSAFIHPCVLQYSAPPNHTKLPRASMHCGLYNSPPSRRARKSKDPRQARQHAGRWDRSLDRCEDLGQNHWQRRMRRIGWCFEYL